MIDSLLRQHAPALGLSLSAAQLAAFEQYAGLLIDWNQRVNLTRIIVPEEIAVRHFLDSLSVCAALPAELPVAARVVDVGSGAGFPGVPLKLVFPAWRLTLLETTGKKAKFLEHLTAALSLPAVTVLKARAEEAGQQPGHRRQYDLALARAVAGLPLLAEYMLPLLRVGGLMIAQKGQNPQAEVEAAANALATLGGGPARITAVQVPTLLEARHLVIIKKEKPTPADYPRRPGLPAKRPL